MPALQPQVQLSTLEQYEALPKDKRVEVFDGVIYDMSSPSQEHQTISMELSTMLNTYVKGNKGLCRVFHAPFDVKLSDMPLTIVQLSNRLCFYLLHIACTIQLNSLQPIYCNRQL
ncbi:MAG: Uma2 family endonuclease [Lachnospiraceae bacterium]|nr:Uma2 family endonuclease [Lachnospiraceae bacterium]